jgi:ABC-type Fe3+/spermidine/putrescine transport system ATPase subunit
MLRVLDLHLSYQSKNGPVNAVRGVSFTVQQGQFYTLLGPSGCGKTSTLRSIAGLETPTRGEIEIGTTVVYSSANRMLVPTHKRDIGMVFQSYAIWPHMTVFDNIAFPLLHGSHNVPKNQVRDRVMRVLSLVQLQGLADRPAPDLSGGQQQRVALARAIAKEPQVLLLDEPLSNLDAKLREDMRHEIKDLVRRLATTTLYVTHDQLEALSMSDTVALMKDGVVVQEGNPRDLYLHHGLKEEHAFTHTAAAEFAECGVSLIQREGIRKDVPYGDVAIHREARTLRQQHGAEGPGAVHGELFVDDIRCHFERCCSLFANKTRASPRAGGFGAVRPRLRIARAVERRIRTLAVGELANGLNWCVGGDRLSCAQPACKLATLRQRVHRDDARAHRRRELCRGESNRTLTEDRQRIATRNVQALQRGIRGTGPARDCSSFGE